MRLLSALALLAPLTACAALGDDGDGIQVATAFYPLEYAASRVAGDLARIESLTVPGKEPHDMEPTIAETALIARADLVVHTSDFQPAIDDAIGQNAAGAVLDAATVVDLESTEGGDPDPHFWLDPVRMADLGDAIAEELAEIDPEHTADYAANGAALRADMERLDTAYAAGLSACERSTIVVSHDAFGYLGRYGLDLEPIAGLSPDAEPTPADLARLQQLIDDEGVTTVFSERLAPARLSESLADDLGIATAVLDPIEGLTEETEGEDYVSLMEQNLLALQRANGC